jgi:hypothetical protein
MLVHNLLCMVNCFLEHSCLVNKFLAVSGSGIVFYYIHESYSPDSNFITQQVMGLKMHGIKFRFMFILLELSTAKTIGAGACIVTLYTKLLQLSVNHFVTAHFVSLPFACLCIMDNGPVFMDLCHTIHE